MEGKDIYRNLFENAVDPIVILDKKGKFTEINNKVVEILGYTRKDLIGKKFTEVNILTKKSKLIAYKNFIKRMAGFGIKPYEIEIIKKNGEIIIGEINASSVKENDKIIGDMIIIRDVTERKKAEEELKMSEEKWSSLTENTNDIIMIVDNKGIIQYINRTIPPFTPEGTIGKTVYEYTQREQHDIMMRSLREVFKTGKPGNYEISSNIPKIGMVWFNTKVVPIKRYGNVNSVIMISTDITERKKAEEQLKKSKDNIQSKVEELERFNKIAVGRELRMIELKNRIKELEEKLGEKSK